MGHRAVRLASVLAGVLVMSIACGSNPASTSSSNSTGAPGGPGAGASTGLVSADGTAPGHSADAPDSGGGTRTIIDIEGTAVTVPVHPLRVVTLSEPTLDGALALGITPVGTTSGRGQSTVPHYLATLAGEIPLLGAIAQPNYEEIGKAKPDLILVDGTSINNNPPAIEVLRTIAPTVYCGYAGGDWRTTFGYVADALNLADKGTQVLADYDRHVAMAKAGLGKYADDTFSIVRWQGGAPALILEDLPPGQALADLGLRRPPAQDRKGLGHADPVSLENLATIDADYLFFGTLGGSSVTNPQAGGSADIAGAKQALGQAEQTPGFRDLKAYKDNHVILVDGSLWNSTGGPLLMNGIIDAVQQALAG